MRLVAVAMMAATLAGCSSAPRSDLPRGDLAYKTIPEVATTDPVDYRIGALDTIAVNVFQEPELSATGITVDSSGSVLLPLIGTMMAQGKSAPELSKEIATKLQAKYLQDPQVTVLVQSSASQKVTVEGSVNDPGVFEIKGRTSLIDALAMAKGTSRVARTTEVVVFREVGGKRIGAVFDIDKIRRGAAPDPEVLGRDTVVVGLSNVKAAWRDFLQTAPLLNIFRPF